MDRSCEAQIRAICRFQEGDIGGSIVPERQRIGKPSGTPRLRHHPLGLMLRPHMVQEDGKRNVGEDRKESSSGDSIPPRRQHRQGRKTNIPPQPSIRRHLIQLLVASAIGLALMLVLLMMAVKYAQRDWSRKDQKAHASRISRRSAEGVVEAAPSPQGWAYSLPAGATGRHLKRLASEPLTANPWVILARGVSDRQQSQVTIGALRMAMAIGGESAAARNDLGAAYLQQKRLRNAADQFGYALQIAPGFPPALFNLALCSIAERNPGKGTELLGQYLARRPDDTAAYRLQATLLSQMGRPGDALVLLEKFLRDQPSDQPLFLEAAMLAARLGKNGNALRYLETALAGNPIQSVVRAYQSSAFRSIRLSGEGDALATRIANRARVAYGAPLPAEEYQPLRSTPDAILR